MGGQFPGGGCVGVTGDVCVGVTGTHTPFCRISLVRQFPDVKGEDEDVVGTQTPFCSVELVPQTLDELDVPEF